MTWVDTDFPYMIWEGEEAPNCPYCFQPLNEVNRRGVTKMEYYPSLNQLMFEHVDTYGYYCKCGFPIDTHYGVGLNGVRFFWIDEAQAKALGVPYKEVK